MKNLETEMKFAASLLCDSDQTSNQTLRMSGDQFKS
jgi:hypothetical protein